MKIGGSSGSDRVPGVLLPFCGKPESSSRSSYVGSCTTIGNRSKIIGRRSAEGVGFDSAVAMKTGVRSEERGTGVLIVHRLQLPRNAPPTAS